jgi:hypothetical protein
VELYIHSPKTPSWRGAQFKKHRANALINFMAEIKRGFTSLTPHISRNVEEDSV